MAYLQIPEALLLSADPGPRSQRWPELVYNPKGSRAHFTRYLPKTVRTIRNLRNLDMGLSINRGTQNRPQNTRILIIRTPK